jgi:hypothetical protein
MINHESLLHNNRDTCFTVPGKADASVSDIPFCYQVGRKDGINTGQVQPGCVDWSLGILRRRICLPSGAFESVIAFLDAQRLYENWVPPISVLQQMRCRSAAQEARTDLWPQVVGNLDTFWRARAPRL